MSLDLDRLILLLQDGGVPIRHVLQHQVSKIGDNCALNEKVIQGEGQQVNSGIISSLTARFGDSKFGVWKHDLAYIATNGSNENLSLVIKCKPSASVQLEIASAVGATVDPLLGYCGRVLLNLLELTDGAEREAYLYALNSDAFPALNAIRPKAYGSYYDSVADSWFLVLEYVEGDSSEGGFTARWSDSQIDAVVQTIAGLHSETYRRRNELTDPSMKPMLSQANFAEARFLWGMMGEMTEEYLSRHLGKEILVIFKSILDSAPQWWEERLIVPHSLIHNDLNPRNILFCPLQAGKNVSKQSICVYDWELSTFAPPEQDIAELLCSILPKEAQKTDIDNFLAAYRKVLIGNNAESSSRCAVSQSQFRNSLRYLLINKFSMYALLTRVLQNNSPLMKDLPVLLKNWKKLWDWYGGR